MLELPEIQAKIAQGTVSREEMAEVIKHLRGDREIAQAVREIKKASRSKGGGRADLDEWMGSTVGENPEEQSLQRVATDTKIPTKSSGQPQPSPLDSFLPSKE